MPASLNVVALISGGKDSLYSLLHCIQNGHKVIALANVHPLNPVAPHSVKGTCDNVHDIGPEDELEDVNSFMYQTVGHSIIPLYSPALNLPLYRRGITGGATQTGRYYDDSATASQEAADETEDLVPLLEEVMQNHPEANAISSGAILSTYQRTRIESVALRLRVTPLAFLWQYPALPPPTARSDSFTGLLDDMAAAGCDARLIKIASGGIKESLLWSEVSSTRTKNRIMAGLSPFFEGHEFGLRGAILGEGGEYETLAINGPKRVWKRRIEIDSESNVIVNDEGGASHLRFGKARLLKQEQSTNENEKGDLVRVPVLLDERFLLVQERVFAEAGMVKHPGVTPFHTKQQQSIDQTMAESSTALRHRSTRTQLHDSCGSIDSLLSPSHTRAPCLPLSVKYSTDGNRMTIANITIHKGDNFADLIQHLRAILQSLSQKHHTPYPLSPDDIVFSTILLAAENGATFLNRFAQLNAEYSKLFTKPNPPARVTVACNLPDGALASMSVVLDLGPRENRRGLHVQSRSYWAPANIGPYSQAIGVPVFQFRGEEGNGTEDRDDAEIVYVAGQIPLVPHSIQLLEGTFLHHAVLSLQHLWRIGQEREIDWWTAGIAFLAKGKPDDSAGRAKTAWELWRETHRAVVEQIHDDGEEEDAAGLDAWDRKHNRYGSYGHGLPSLMGTTTPTPSGHHLHTLPNRAVLLSAPEHAPAPPVLAVEVDALPRGAPIEWQGLGLAGLSKPPNTKPRISLYISTMSWGRIHHCTLHPPPGIGNERSKFDFICMQITRGHESEVRTIESLAPLTAALDEQTTQQQPGTKAPRHFGPESDTVHATAYVSAEHGWAVLDKLQPIYPGTTIVPCRNIWAEHGQQLSLAMTLQQVSKQPS